MRPLAPLLALALAAPGAAAAQDLAPVSFGTNWLPQAEHGGFYQALAEGRYEACGLDVTIVPGGPQVNNRALLFAGRLDFYMGGDLLQPFAALAEGIPTVAVAAIFQKHPQVILAHPGKAETFEDLKDLEIMVSDNAFASFYQWMMGAYGFTEEQRRPYTFSPAPFLADEGRAMQGYLTSEPYSIQKEAGFEPDVFLLADNGYSTYATLIETMRGTLGERPEAVECFVSASIEGWESYLDGDPEPGNALIREANPEMTPERIAFAIDAMKRNGIVRSGDAETMGVGAMTAEKVRDFHDLMVEAGVIEPLDDPEAVFDARFVGGAPAEDAGNTGDTEGVGADEAASAPAE